VRLSVRLSVTLRYCTKSTKARIMISSRPESLIILVSGNIWFITKFERGHPERGQFISLLVNLQPVGEKLTESAAQPCSILCTANHNIKIRMSECITYPPKCASGEGKPPFRTLFPRRLDSPLDLAPKLPNETKIGTPTFRIKVTAL